MSTTELSTMEIANSLVEWCRQGKNHDVIRTWYAEDAVSVEASAPPGQSAESVGRDAILAEGQWWADNHEVHTASVSGPWPHGDCFIETFRYEVTVKPTGTRIVMDEAALYETRSRQDRARMVLLRDVIRPGCTTADRAHLMRSAVSVPARDSRRRTFFSTGFAIGSRGSC